MARQQQVPSSGLSVSAKSELQQDDTRTTAGGRVLLLADSILEAYLLGDVEFKEATGKACAGGVILGLVEDTHGRVEAQDLVPRMQVGVREVCRQLSSPCWVVLDILPG